jgi:hypothetical protein
MDELTEGAIVDGLVQQVTREDGVVRISLLALPGTPVPPGNIRLPEPVRIEAGEVVCLEFGEIPGSAPDAPSLCVRMSSRAVVTGTRAWAQNVSEAER